MWLEGQEHELRSKKQMFSDLCCMSGVQLIVPLCGDDNSDFAGQNGCRGALEVIDHGAPVPSSGGRESRLILASVCLSQTLQSWQTKVESAYASCFDPSRLKTFKY